MSECECRTEKWLEEPQWEPMTFDPDIQRLPVPGGWLYREWADGAQSPSLCFVPHPCPKE